MSRHIAISAVDGNTGFLIAELILTNEAFKKEVASVSGLALNPRSEHCKELEELGAVVIPHEPGRLRNTVNTLKKAQIDAICLIPPAHRDKLEITIELIEAAKKAGIPNVCLLSSAGCDLAERDKQPRLREFVDIEAHMMASKGDATTSTGHSPVIVR